VLVRTRAGARELCNGRRSGGSTAVSEGGETDERDPLVSDHAERGSARAARLWAERAWAEQSGPACGPISKPRAAVTFPFSFLCSFCYMFEFV